MTFEEAPRKETPENTEATKWGTFWKITGFLTFGLAGFLIGPYTQVGNDLKARAIYACMALTLYLFILLLIYLYAYKEELSEFIFKIFNAIKNFPPYIWRKIKPTKESLKKVTLFTGLALALLVECFLIYKVIESFNLHSEKIKNLPTNFNFSLKSDKLSEIQDIRNSTFIYSFGSLLILLLIALPFIKSALKNHILRTFVTTVISGGILAFLIPTFLYNYGFIGDTKDLTTALLGVTGGVVALFSLIKSHQKSELEREQLEVQKQKDSRDHTRQVHAARRDRYIGAVEQLAGEKATIRLGGAYSLVNLVDEWLNDTSVKKKKRKKEAQAIIDYLCTYIRSPFALSELHPTLNKLTKSEIEKIDIETILKNKVEFYGEKNVRETIVHEINSRLSSGDAKDQEGPWSNFNYDFSGAHIFYQFDLSNSFLYADSNFSDINFLCDAKFNSITFKNTADFSNTVFHGSAEFSNTTFEDIAYFWKTEFKESVAFVGAQFKSTQGIQTNGILPSDSRYLQFKSSADFRQAIFGKIAKFGRAKFYGSADFRGAWFKTRSPFFHILGTLKIYAEFSQNVGSRDYIFDQLHNRSYSIATETKTYKTKFKWREGEYLSRTHYLDIPKGCHLFKP